MWTEFAQRISKKKRFRTTVGLSMEYGFEAGYNWSILGKLR